MWGKRRGIYLELGRGIGEAEAFVAIVRRAGSEEMIERLSREAMRIGGKAERCLRSMEVHQIGKLDEKRVGGNDR
jgi:hypothetical protein